ncbi:putative phage abortive infection protein [Pseudomonas sp. S09G 359]|uniref:putative phage abortive infection protein n=1 Tax=Pseudomonas sp. S09G 359 TaxID=2054919 RepID=UPI0012FEF22B|nr:putative phage abortive infection protein [Pseudomonas sp. S09G 359]
MEAEDYRVTSGSSSSQGRFSVIPLWLMWLVGGVALLTVFMLAMYLKTFGTVLSNKQDVWGQFGDFFGGILNPLLSSLALAAVLVTLRIQGQDLKAAQDENRQTNLHLDAQARYIRLQSFESVFFRLLDLHLNAKKEFTLFADGVESKGVSGFERVGNELSEFELNTLLVVVSNDEARSAELISQRFEEQFGNVFSTYFRSMYQVLKYVDAYTGFKSSHMPAESLVNPSLAVVGSDLVSYISEYQAKRQYVNMLRAQMEQAERRVLFSSCLTAKGAGLKFYVEKYSLLKGMNVQRTSLTDEQAYSFYSSSAFHGHESIDYALLKANDKKQPI